MVIDMYGLSAEDVRVHYPAAYQWLLERVKPERDHNNRESRRRNWWLFGETNPLLRRQLSGLPRYIATVETTKHRVFQFLDADILPDNMLVNIALPDAYALGVLSSRVHVAWALTAGGRLGVGNDPRYNKSRCFEPFPFPAATADQQTEIRALAEELDAHRKRQQAAHPALTLTGMYNVLERLRSGDALNAKEKAIHEQGLVSVLRELHDRLDAAVLAAYGWSDLAPALVGRPGATLPLADKAPEQAAAEEELLSRLVALNAERAAEEARGHVRWLRPEFQNPSAADATSPGADAGSDTAPVERVSTRQQTLDIPHDDATTDGDGGLKPALQGDAGDGENLPPASRGAAKAAKTPWPKTLPEQVQTLRAQLATAPAPLTAETLARRYTGARAAKVAEVLDTLVALGQARRDEASGYAA
jgi:hypothetical protein